MPITYTSQDQVEVYRFNPAVAIGVPLVALFLQAFLPWRMHFFSLFDLPLLLRDLRFQLSHVARSILGGQNTDRRRS